MRRCPAMRYELTADIEITGDPVPWLIEPERVARWTRTDVAPQPDGSWRVEAGEHYGAAYVASTAGLTRSYVLANGDAYTRTVTYTHEGTTVSCTVVTDIPELDERAAQAGIRAEQRALDDALGSLRDHVEGRRRLFRRGFPAQPL